MLNAELKGELARKKEEKIRAEKLLHILQERGFEEIPVLFADADKITGGKASVLLSDFLIVLADMLADRTFDLRMRDGAQFLEYVRKGKEACYAAPESLAVGGAKQHKNPKPSDDKAIREVSNIICEQVEAGGVSIEFVRAVLNGYSHPTLTQMFLSKAHSALQLMYRSGRGGDKLAYLQSYEGCFELV